MPSIIVGKGFDSKVNIVYYHQISHWKETFMQSELKQAIRDLLKERNAVLLAHNYMRDEVQEIADITGDSLGLSQEAAKTSADLIVFCGVHFMAESAAILSPGKTVLLPRLDAGCPMADMITAENLRRFKSERPGVPVVTYVNSSAEVKAESDICCTSANALKVVNSLPDKEIIFTPDRNLGHYVSQFTDKKFHLWDGYCPTHERLKPEAVIELKKNHPDALFICHPECNPAVTALADHACSTSGMYDYCKKSPAKEFIIGTEAGILYRLKAENPGKKFILASPALICPNMKLTSLEDILASLQTMRPVVKVEESVRLRAKTALDRMIAVPRD